MFVKRERTDFVIWHCSATKPSQHIGAARIREWHMASPNNYVDIGYHLVIPRSGDIEVGRPLDVMGAHAPGYNTNSVAVCMVGGLDELGRTFINAPSQYTPQQWECARIVATFLRRLYPSAKHQGHRDCSPDTNRDGKITQQEWLKTCPGFDVAQQLAI